MPQRLAVIATVYRSPSLAQHIVDPFLIGYPRDGQWHKPGMQVVSLYLDQKAEGDLAAQGAAEFGFQLYPTIAETLRCGSEKLAVDAVLIVGPQPNLFKQCIEVFDHDRRTAPVYNGAYPFTLDEANWIVEAARRLNFPLMTSSPLPAAWRLPEPDLPQDCQIEEALVVSPGGPGAGYQALEAMQSMIERRRGGETGIQAVRMIEGDEVWKAGRDGRWSPQLLTAALSRSDTPQGLTLQDGRTQDLATNGQLPKLVANPAACVIEHRDGLRATLLTLAGAIKDFTFAARIKSRGIQSTQFLPDQARLVSQIEDMFVTGKSPSPLDRTLIVSRILQTCQHTRK